jgi:hypothetical protein
VTLALLYRLDPIRILELAHQEPELVATMIVVAEELGEELG